MFNTRKHPYLISLFVLVLVATPSILRADGESIFLFSDYHLSNNGLEFGFYPSGYSDGFYWGYMAGKHEYGRHEMLCGDYGAALFYNGCHSNHSNWLEAHFFWPNWDPDTAFVDTRDHPNDFIVWQNSSSARSIIG
jgi:hypothetical protein